MVLEIEAQGQLFAKGAASRPLTRTGGDEFNLWLGRVGYFQEFSHQFLGQPGLADLPWTGQNDYLLGEILLDRMGYASKAVLQLSALCGNRFCTGLNSPRLSNRL